MFLKNFFAFIVAISYAAHSDAFMISACGPLENTNQEYIKAMFSNINININSSNESTIAFLIASALTAKHGVPLDLKYITDILNKETSNAKLISMLDIKNVINQLGYKTKGVQPTNFDDLQTLTDQILITQDLSKNYVAFVGSTDTNIFSIYGYVNNDALICPINKRLFLNNYSNKIFLIIE